MNSLVQRIASRLSLPLAAGRPRTLVAQIAAYEPQLAHASAGELRKMCLALQYRAKSGEPLARLLGETYALVREAARRTLAMRHFDVQMLGGIAMHFQSIAEMQTGEGKTLTATLPVTLAALAGKGAHLATVNDYLARRDAEWMRRIYEYLGLTVGVVESDSSSAERRAAYACDITYGTAKEFGFDFLRDRLARRKSTEDEGGFLASDHSAYLGHVGSQAACVQRGHFFAMIDEADNVLIDDASTPLIISAMPGDAERREVVAYRFAATAAGHFVDREHFEYDADQRSVHLLPAGQRLARSLKHPDALKGMSLVTIYEFLERAICVRRDFHRDQQYVVRDGEIVIVDEFTGRLAEGRKWRRGIHQAVEAQEQLIVTVDAGQAAQITIQDYFRQYEHLAGMTGTASSNAAEFKKTYRLRVRVVPTNRPIARRVLPARVFADRQAKWSAIVDEVRAMHALGRPVLIGTRSIDKSEQLSERLTAVGIEHQVLNAHQVAAEAQIVAQAGERGRVTVATNMAGRGTDVRLGPGVAELGGLHVIATEMHEAARIDRQLFGRCGRQGDPGTVRQFVSLDDELLSVGLGLEEAEQVARRVATESPAAADRWLTWFRRAQRKIELRQFRQRQALLYHEQHRRQAQREMGQDPYLDCLG